MLWVPNRVPPHPCGVEQTNFLSVTDPAQPGRGNGATTWFLWNQMCGVFPPAGHLEFTSILTITGISADWSSVSKESLPAMQKTWVWSLGQEDPLEKEMTHSSILAWRIPWTEEPGLQRVKHDYAFTCTDEKVHGTRSKRVLSTEACVSVGLGCTIHPACGCAHQPVNFPDAILLRVFWRLHHIGMIDHYLKLHLPPLLSGWKREPESSMFLIMA